MLKWIIVQNYKTSWKSSKLIDTYNISIELNARDGISRQYWIVRDFLIFNRSLTLALHMTPPLLSNLEKKLFQKVLGLL